MSCKLLRIETSTETLPRKRYVCSCGRIGTWTAGHWRSIPAERDAIWNWRSHAGIKASWVRRRSGVATEHVYASEITTEDDSQMWRYVCSCGTRGTCRYRHERRANFAWIRHRYAANGRTASRPEQRPTPPGIKPGALVEWEPEYASGTMRGTVTRVADGRVFVEVERKASGRRRKSVETWFEPDEAHRLRVAGPERSRSAPAPQIEEHW